MAPPVTTLDDDYELLRRLGRGGMGEVWLARRRRDGAEVALKRPLGAVGPEERARIAREVAVLRGLAHPRLARLEDLAADPDGNPVLVYEYVPGVPLDQARGATRPDDATLRRWLEDIAEALDALHATGLVHRDLKPENVMIDPTGRARVLDFGLARAIGPGGTVTATGMVLGTPGFMAPEVLRGERPGPAADRFAFGVLAAWLWSGRPLFPGDSPGEVVQAILAGRREDTGNAGLDHALDSVLAPAPAARPGSCRAVVDVLTATLAGGEPAAPTRALPLAREAVAEHETRRIPPPTDAAPPARPTRGLPAALAVALVAGVALATRPAPAPTPPPPSPEAAPARHPFDDAWFQALGQQLETRALAPHLDPLDTLRLATVAPAAQVFWDWIAAGNHAEDLPPEVVTRLRSQEPVLEDRALPPLFEPFLPRAEDPQPCVIPEAMREDYFGPLLPANPIAPGLLAIAAHALIRAEAEHRRLAESMVPLSLGDIPPDAPAGLKDLYLFASGGLKEFVESAAGKASHRVTVLPMLRRVTTEQVRALHFMARAMAEASDPQDRLAVAHLVRTFFARRTALLGGPFALFDPAVVLGPGLDAPLARSLRGRILYGFAYGRAMSGSDHVELAARAAADLAAAYPVLLGARDEVDFAVRKYRVSVLTEEVRALLLAERPEAALATYVAREGWLREDDNQGDWSRILEVLAPVLARATEPGARAAGQRATDWLRTTDRADSPDTPFSGSRHFRILLESYPP